MDVKVNINDSSHFLLFLLL